MRDTIRSERKAKERDYSGPPLLTESDKQEEQKRQQALTKKFNRESALWFKIKQTASKAYQKELANQNTKKAKDIKLITQKKLNDQLKEDIAKMTQDINKLQKNIGG